MSGSRREGALRAVDASIVHFTETTRAERERLYRLWLQARVTAISPLASDLAMLAGMRLDDVVRLLPVPRSWPRGGAAVRTPKGGGTLHGATFPRSRVSRPTLLRLGRAGVPVRRIDDPAGDLGFLPGTHTLEAVSTIGGATLHTAGGNGILNLPGTMPETALCALHGRTVDAAVSHPALDGRAYPIVAAAVDEFVGGTVLVFATGLLPLELPWAEELESEQRACWARLMPTMGHSGVGKLERYVRPAGRGAR